MFVGSVVSGIARWRPVGVVESSTSNTAFGHGVMQWLIPSGLHCASIGRACPLPHAATTKSTTAARIGNDATPIRARRSTARYIRAVSRLVVVIALAVAACGGHTPEPASDHGKLVANRGS